MLLPSLAAVLTLGACAGTDVGSVADDQAVAEAEEQALTESVDEVIADAEEALIERDNAEAAEIVRSELLDEPDSGDVDLDGDVVCEVGDMGYGPVVITTATNSGTERSKYWFTLDAFDGDEPLIEQGVVQIRQILPGESVSEPIDLLEVEEVSDTFSCQTSAVNREPHDASEATVDQQDDIGGCSFDADDESPWIDVDIAVANDSDSPRSYFFDVIIYDDGVRVGQHYSGTERGPGESSNTNVGFHLSNSSIDSLTCEAVGIEVLE